MNFFKRPPHTLLYLSKDKIIRLDCDRKGVIKGELEQLAIACESTSSLPVALDQLINQTKKPLGRKIWILYSNLNSHQLSLPTAQVEGVNDDILEQALQFEYEALTGETFSKSNLSYQFINEADELSYFWVNSIATETLARLELVLREAKCSLAGLTHAGGLPSLLSLTDSSSWVKLEYWDNSVFALAKSPETGLSLNIFHPAQNNDWEKEVDSWLLETGIREQSEALFSGQLLKTLSNIENPLFLDKEENLTLCYNASLKMKLKAFLY